MPSVKMVYLFAALLLAGCNDRTVNVEVPTSHPAHPDAVAAALPVPSTTLDIHQETDADGVMLIPRLDAEPAPRGGDEHVHHHHHGDAAPPGVASPHISQPAAAPGASSTGTAPAASSALYWCTHHHDVVQAGPGTCPTCGMTLVPKPADGDRK